MGYCSYSGVWVVLWIGAVCVHQGWGQEKTCTFKNKGKEYEANEGEVVEVKKTKLRLCENGKTVLKKKTEFKLPYKFACKGPAQMVVPSTVFRWEDVGCGQVLAGGQQGQQVQGVDVQKCQLSTDDYLLTTI
eukprot:GFUD01082463.1.p1 GENE.GFUD01082463.1~~GFUD01082463.1.p1  ORF type:complete len:141 (+),score=42.88 GFUD01082463.1:28-423(+)